MNGVLIVLGLAIFFILGMAVCLKLLYIGIKGIADYILETEEEVEKLNKKRGKK